MNVTLVRDKQSRFPEHPRPETVTALRVWHCKYKSLSGLAAFSGLSTLVVATYPDADFTPIGGLGELEYLSLLHLPKVTDLAPLAQLERLTTVRLVTLPSWDSSGRTTVLDSLAPLAALPNLRHLELFGVVPKARSLRELEQSGSLRSVRVSKYPAGEAERFYGVTGFSNAFAPDPEVEDWG